MQVGDDAPSRGMGRSAMPLFLLVAPLTLFLLVLYAYPVLAMLSRSIYEEGWTIGPFVQVFGDAIFWRVIGITASISVIVTLVCLGLGYPLAYVLARLDRKAANLAMVLVLVPFWTSILVRSYAWMVLLGRRGVINDALIGLGIVSRPLQLLNTRFAVYLAMVHILLPFMILPLYGVLRSFDWRLHKAAQNLGASPAGALRQIVLPLSLPGVAAGCVLVFTLSIGFYITPALLGGPSDVMISMLIDSRVARLDWATSAAMATVLLAIVLAALAVCAHFVPLNKLFRR